MAWFVIAEDDASIRETLIAVGIPAEYTHIDHPRNIRGIAFPAEFSDDVLRVLGEDPAATRFEPHPTNISEFYFAIPRGPTTVDSDFPLFREVLRRTARRLNLPITFSSQGELGFPEKGLLVFERPEGTAGARRRGYAFGIEFTAKIAEPGNVRIPIAAEDDFAAAEVDYRRIGLLVKLSTVRPCGNFSQEERQNLVISMLESILERAIPIARDPRTLKEVARREEEEKQREEERRKKAEEEKRRREEEAREKAVAERKRLDKERRARLEAIGPEKRRIWIEECRKRRSSDVAHFERRVLELRDALRRAASRLIEVGWQIKQEEARISVLDQAALSLREDAGRLYDELSANPLVRELLSEGEGRFVIRTVPIPQGSASASSWRIRFGACAPEVTRENGVPGHERAIPLQIEVLIALTKLIAERNFGAALELLRHSAEGEESHA